VPAHGERRAVGATMGVMWMFMILLWRVLSKVLRRFGQWALLAPVAVIGAALFGLNSWTVLTVLIALLLAVVLALILLGRRSAGVVSLLPVTMLGAGICGLWAAASMAGSWVQGPFSLWQTVTVFGRPAAFRKSAAPGPPKPAGPVYGSGVKGSSAVVRPRAAVQGSGFSAHSLSLQALARARKGVYQRVPGRPQVIVHAQSLLWGRLLILGSLLLLAVGLWLAPRALADLRTQFAKVAPHLRRWAREGNWGILLVPVTSFGLTMFGVRPWTVAAIIVAVVITIRWPRLAADLVPLVLVLFALYGFLLASRWVAGPKALVTPGVTWFGAVPVDSPQTSLLAGVEASALLALAAWLFPRTLGAHARGKATSEQAAELTARVQRLTETRNQAVDAAAAELRRIERDLHDGTQARLVALGMNLRALERMLPDGSPGALALVAEARETSLRALNDLRHLVRGIYPPVLADRGLAHATRALALDSPLLVELDIDLPGRLAPPVESACYFAVAEMLANAVKHSGARRVHIRIQHTAGVLRIEVADDGTGGADPARGTGLSGVERRLGTFDGILAVSSPPGGPTMIAMEVPCVLSSPKTCSC
jgi:signal transduction histidine kinase